MYSPNICFGMRWESRGNFAKSHEEYRAQRRLWKDKIAEGKAKLERCGNCSARAKIEKELPVVDADHSMRRARCMQRVSRHMPPATMRARGIFSIKLARQGIGPPTCGCARFPIRPKANGRKLKVHRRSLPNLKVFRHLPCQAARLIAKRQ
jgi:hypothetical protein